MLHSGRTSSVILIIIIAVLLFPSTAAATTPPIITMDANFAADGDLVVTVTSHDEKVSSITLTLTTAGELLDIAAPPTPLSLPLEVPTTIRVPARRSAAGRFGTLTIKASNEQFGLIHAVEVPFLRDNGRPERRVTQSEYAAAVASILDERDAAAEEQRAAAYIKAVLARGKVPALIGDEPVAGAGVAVPNTNFERAWNRLVSQLNKNKGSLRVQGSSLHAAPTLFCGPYVESPDNRDYPVQGWTSYDDDRFGPDRRLQEPGYPGFVTTRVLYENDCFVQWRNRAFGYTTGWDGSFSVTVRTGDDPSFTDPIQYVSTTAPDVGERSCANTCATIITNGLLLYPPDDRYSFQFGTVYLYPRYTAANAPNRFYFHWDDEIKSLQRRWAEQGFGASYTPFIAGHDSAVGTGAYFSSAGSGIVAFADDAEWTSLWPIAHECGHFFQYELQGNHWGYGMPHTVCGQIDEGPAFKEGFASWHGSYWETDGRSLYVPCIGGECYSNCATPGYRVELNVTAFFWDIFDGTNDPNTDQSVDTVSFGLNLLYSWALRDYTSFDDFYSDFRSANVWGAAEPTTAALRTVNRVDTP